MPKRLYSKEPMAPTMFRQVGLMIGFKNPQQLSAALGISPRQSQAYAAGTSVIPLSVEKLLAALLCLQEARRLLHASLVAEQPDHSPDLRPAVESPAESAS